MEEEDPLPWNRGKLRAGWVPVLWVERGRYMYTHARVLFLCEFHVFVFVSLPLGWGPLSMTIATGSLIPAVDQMWPREASKKYTRRTSFYCSLPSPSRKRNDEKIRERARETQIAAAESGLFKYHGCSGAPRGTIHLSLGPTVA